MASIVITIATDGAAFHDGFIEPSKANPGYEVARILRVMAGSFEKYGESGAFDPRDINGDRVSKVEVIEGGGA